MRVGAPEDRPFPTLPHLPVAAEEPAEQPVEERLLLLEEERTAVLLDGVCDTTR